MKYVCATTIPVKIYQAGRNYFPLVQKLDGKKIYSVILCDCLPTDGSNKVTDDYFNSITLNLTGDGVYYPIKDVVLTRFELEMTRGVNIPIDRYLHIQDCFVHVPDDISSNVIGKTLTLLVWYEQSGYNVNADSSIGRYDNFEVAVNPAKIRNYFPDDRTLNRKSFSQFFASVNMGATAVRTKTPTNVDSVLAADFEKLRITLVKGSYEVWDRVPAIILLQDNWYRRLHLDNVVFDFESSYIEICQGATVTAGNLNINVKFQ